MQTHKAHKHFAMAEGRKEAAVPSNGRFGLKGTCTQNQMFSNCSYYKKKKTKSHIPTDIFGKFKAKSCSLGNHREFCHRAYFPPLLAAKYLLLPTQLGGSHWVLPTLQTEEIKLHSCFADLGRWRHMFHSFVSALLKIYFNILTANIHTLSLIIQMAQNGLTTKHQNGWPFFF